MNHRWVRFVVLVVLYFGITWGAVLLTVGVLGVYSTETITKLGAGLWAFWGIPDAWKRSRDPKKAPLVWLLPRKDLV